MSLLSVLPRPSREYDAPSQQKSSSTALVSKTIKEPPPYGHRTGFVPRRLDDFSDGGAFPEIHVAQYPLDMGRPDKAKTTSNTLALTTNASGEINYDAILKQGRNRDKKIVSEHSALVPKVDAIAEGALRPGEEEVEEVTKDTKAALEAVVAQKISAAQPKSLPTQPGAPTYIKYTPSQRGAQYNSGAPTRIIKMQDMPVDPLEPPKFRHKKVPRGPGSPPVPVMHSPPRAVTVTDQQEWKIPPCISNWKNPKGYTIPLDKRLAADGRGLQEVQINDNFAKFTEALYIAEQKAREAVEMRSKMQRERIAREKEKKEKELRELAMRARMDRLGNGATSAAARVEETSLPPPGEGAAMREAREDREARRQRDEIRMERQKERERERRLDAKEAHGSRKSKLTRDRDRDISEKIALGLANVQAGEAMYDQRLFNQDQGMESGLAADDVYNVYDKPLYAERGSNLYRPKATDDEDYGGNTAAQKRFKPDKGFSGVDYAEGNAASGAPVEFEKEVEADPFGLGEMITMVNKKRKATDGIGSGGGMRAGGGGGKYDDYAAGSSRSKVEFTSGR